MSKQLALDFSLAAAPTWPENALGGLKAKLKSVADLALAVDWLARLKARRQSVEAKRDAAVAEIHARAARELQLDLDGETAVPFEQFEAALTSAIDAYVPRHKADIFEGDTQTTRFAAGEVAWRDKPAEVVLAEGVKAAEIAERLVQRYKLSDAAADVLEETGLVGWLRVKFELDLAAIKRAFKEGKIKAKKLPKGLTVSAAGEAVSVKPFTAPERSEAAA